MKKRSERPVKTLSRVTLPSAAMSFMLNLKAESKLGVMTVCSLLHHHNNLKSVERAERARY